MFRDLQLKGVDISIQWSGKYSKHLVEKAKAKAEQSFDRLLYAENLTLLDRKNISSAYADYVNSFITTNEKKYLTNDELIRQVVPLRDVAGTSIMSEDQFQKEQTLKTRPLAAREKYNVMKTISTIIFICTRLVGFTYLLVLSALNPVNRILVL